MSGGVGTVSTFGSDTGFDSMADAGDVKDAGNDSSVSLGTTGGLPGAAVSAPAGSSPVSAAPISPLIPVTPQPGASSSATPSGFIGDLSGVPGLIPPCPGRNCADGLMGAKSDPDQVLQPQYYVGTIPGEEEPPLADGARQIIEFSNEIDDFVAPIREAGDLGRERRTIN